MKVSKYLKIAKMVALNGDPKRQFLLGAVGLRNDGTLVAAPNLPAREPNKHAHAESRVVRKMDRGGVVFVVRVARNGNLVSARPCSSCQKIMRRRGVKICYYSISGKEFGVLQL